MHLLANKKSVCLIVLAVITAMYSSTAFAGGTCHEMQIVKIAAKGNDEYELQMLLKQHYRNHDENENITIHLRHTPKKIKTYPPHINDKKGYLLAFNKLMDFYKSGESFCFGTMGGGLVRIDGTKNEYQSNALEYKGNPKRIMSYANPV